MNNIENKIVTGRISEVQRDSFQIFYEGKELPAKLKGNFYMNSEEQEFPVVGDYVEFLYNPYGDCRIERILPRTSLLKRPDQSGHAMGYVKTMKEQVMIANFDYVFIVTSLNGNYNANRIARYISITVQGGGIPVVLLSKADLCENVETYKAEIKKMSEKVRVHAISSITGQGLETIGQYLVAGKTVALLGSSGVGKSTLVNALFGYETMKTGAIRESDSKGRHTTTHRQLLQLPTGAFLIDTPGMRELGMCDVSEGIADTFSDVEELVCQCKFSDCRHESEPGCAVRKALEDGTLSMERWELYQGLQVESEHNRQMLAKQEKKNKQAFGKPEKKNKNKKQMPEKEIAKKRKQLNKAKNRRDVYG